MWISSFLESLPTLKSTASRHFPNYYKPSLPHSTLTLWQLPSEFCTSLMSATGFCPHQHSMAYHSKPHIFKFTLDQAGKATLQTKDWSTSPHWCDTTGLTRILSSLPDGQPRLVKKSFTDIDIQQIERGAEKLRPYFQPGDIEAWRSLWWAPNLRGRGMWR